MDATSYKKGLSNNEVKINKEKYGTNIISRNQKNSFLKLLIESLSDPIIKILLIVLAVKTVFLFQNFDWFETLGIVIAITLASLISTISEYGSEKSFEKLQEESSRINCRVYRESGLKEIFIDDVVLGDILSLENGDLVPADAIILEGTLSVDESSFSGETKDVHKKVNDNIYRGSIITNGKVLAKVTNVGLNTKYGKIALELLNQNPVSPLRIRLRELAQIISKIGYTGAILVFISYLFSVIFISNNFDMSLIMSTLSTPKIIFGHIIYALTLSVTIIIVSVPEGLPMMVALVLSSNMKRMVKNNVLVRRMVGIETSGSMTTLITDKTGTITKGNLSVNKIVLGNGRVISKREDLNRFELGTKILNNLFYNNESIYGDNNKIIGGNSTDKALMAYVGNMKFKAKIYDKVLFTSVTKFSSVKLDDGLINTYIKGAPEFILKSAYQFKLDNNEVRSLDKVLINNILSKYTKEGYRIIALGEKKRYSEDIIFDCLVLLKDEVKEESYEAVKLIRGAGVNTIMITGDAKDTAISIGKEIGLLESFQDIVLTSDELKNYSDEKLQQMFPKIRIVARALPTDKSRLVKIGQSINEVVGMTGDGVNDAPALKCADVGFSMGSGSEVSKEASDIVILDNNLLSIGKAILYGRTIFKSIRKFIIFQLTMNICALTLSILGPFLSIKTPVTVMQMLWINMIMDTFAGLAFSFEPPLKEYMNELPNKKNTSIINTYMYSSILMTGLYTSLLLIIFLKSPSINSLFRYSPANKYLMTAFFGLFVFSGVFNAFNARTNRINIFSNLFKNKPFIFIIILIIFVQMFLLYSGGKTFRTFGLTVKEFIIMLILSLSVIPVDIIRKLILKRKKLNTGV